MTTNDNTLDFYAKLIQVVLQQRPENTADSVPNDIIKRALNWIIREYRGPIQVYISGAAYTLLAAENQKAETLSLKELSHLKKQKMKLERDEEKLFFEHICPISQLIEALFTIEKPYPLSEIQAVLNQISVGLIRRDQRRYLDGNGHRCYREKPLETCRKLLEEHHDTLLPLHKASKFDASKN